MLLQILIRAYRSYVSLLMQERFSPQRKIQIISRTEVLRMQYILSSLIPRQSNYESSVLAKRRMLCLFPASGMAFTVTRKPDKTYPASVVFPLLMIY